MRRGTHSVVPPALRLLLVGLVLLLAAPVPLWTLPAAGAAPAAETVQGSLVVQQVTPGVLAPGEALQVRVRVENTGTATIATPLVQGVLRTRRLDTRAQVQEWADGQRTAQRLVGDTPVGRALAPGESAEVVLDVPSGRLGLGADAGSWGAYGLRLQLAENTPGAFRAVAAGTTFVLWSPEDTAGEVPAADRPRVSLLVPFTAGAPRVSDALLPPDRIERLTAPGGRLDVVRQVAGVRGATWFVDPALLASAARGGDGARAWLRGWRAGAADHDVVALPYADPDVAALAAAGEGDVYGLAEQQGRSTVRDPALGGRLAPGARTDVAWPAAGSVGPAALRLLAGGGRSAVVLTAGTQPPQPAVAGTPTGRGVATADDQTVETLLVDATLSLLLAGTGSQVTTEQAPADPAQRLLAETAVVARDGGGPSVPVAVPRDWAPDPGAARDAVDALLGAPWVEPEGLDALLAATGPGRGEPSYPPADAALELPRDGVRVAGDAVAAASSTASALSDPAAVVEPVERSAVAAVSVAWRADLDGWREGLDALRRAAAAVPAGVRVVPGATVNVLSAETGLPVTVVNDLGQAVDVVLTLRPRSSRLLPEDDVEVTLSAGGRQRVTVPVRVLASGDTQVDVIVTTPDGARLGEPAVLDVRLRADWESRGTLLAAAVALLLLVAGLVRTVRRGRRTDRVVAPAVSTSHQADAHPADAHPADPNHPAGTAARGDQ